VPLLIPARPWPWLCAAVLAACAGQGGEAAAERPVALPPPPTHYRGREIAQTMHWQGAAWLERATRESEEHASRLLAELGVRAGDTVCDLGCGNGYHTLPLARLVGPEGLVYAVDIQPEMLAFLRQRLAPTGFANVRPILGEVADPLLPDRSCDLILMVDVYHELAYPEQMLQRVRAALAPGGRLVLVEFRGEDPDVPILPPHTMTKAQILRELVPNGFRLAGEFDELPWQHVMSFVRDDG
jgi:ubiquinone/menaquinone biosynthesis C-methylase UbiE